MTLFQSTLPRGERPPSAHSLYRVGLVFQSTLPRGERRGKSKEATGCRSFNPRSREGSDSISRSSLLPTPMFQSTLPRGERP